MRALRVPLAAGAAAVACGVSVGSLSLSQRQLSPGRRHSEGNASTLSSGAHLSAVLAPQGSLHHPQQPQQTQLPGEEKGAGAVFRWRQGRCVPLSHASFSSVAVAHAREGVASSSAGGKPDERLDFEWRLFGSSGALDWQRFFSAKRSSRSELSDFDLEEFTRGMSPLLRDYEGLKRFAAPLWGNGESLSEPQFGAFYVLWMHIQTGFLAEAFRANAAHTREMFAQLRTQRGVMELPIPPRTEVDDALDFALFMCHSTQSLELLKAQTREMYPDRSEKYHDAMFKGLYQKFETRMATLSLVGDWPQFLCIRLGSYFFDPSADAVEHMLMMMKQVSDSLGYMPEATRAYSISTLTLVLTMLLQDSIAQSATRRLLQDPQMWQDPNKPQSGWLAKACVQVLGASR